MSRFRVTPQATRDLSAIAKWTLTHWGPAQMATCLRALDQRFQWLADHPSAGRDRSDIEDGYRYFPEGLHLVFYTTQPDSIAIIGIVHQSMDVRGTLPDRR